ncbi:putative plant SNARE 11 [Cryptosporidium felis]|nr:putative plant SNARE 11 [Cryptosporidium felis]
MLDRELDFKFSRLDSLISRYEGLSKTRKIGDSAVSYCSQSINNALDSIQIELESLREPTEKEKFEQFLRKRNDRVKMINDTWGSQNAQLQAKQTEKRDFQEEIIILNRANLSDHEKGDALIQLTEDSILRMKQSLAETEQLGNESLTKMNVQREQIGRIHSELDKVKEGVSRANLSIRAIARSTATDFCVQMLCGVLTISLLIIIIILVVISVRNSNRSQ